MKKGLLALAAVAAMTAAAQADSIDAQYTGVAGGNGAMRVKVNGSTYYAGHMMHDITSGDRAGESFRTFCIELNEFANKDNATYEIVDLADAPNPGTPYGQTMADRISAIVANAEALGWIDGRLQADTDQTGYLGKMGAIQAAIWEALDENVRISSNRTSDELEYYYGVLLDPQTFDDSLRMAGLRAMVARGQQDQLYIVPLPPAALAGAGLLVGFAGVRTLRRRG